MIGLVIAIAVVIFSLPLIDFLGQQRVQRDTGRETVEIEVQLKSKQSDENGSFEAQRQAELERQGNEAERLRAELQSKEEEERKLAEARRQTELERLRLEAEWQQAQLQSEEEEERKLAEARRQTELEPLRLEAEWQQAQLQSEEEEERKLAETRRQIELEPLRLEAGRQQDQLQRKPRKGGKKAQEWQRTEPQRKKAQYLAHPVKPKVTKCGKSCKARRAGRMSGEARARPWQEYCALFDWTRRKELSRHTHGNCSPPAPL
jgi:hypothetical protein